MRSIDLTGQTFGRLTVLQRGPRATGNEITWECVCACGETAVVRGRHLRYGMTTSCGCYHREVCSKDVVDYPGAHERVKRARGAASTHLCVDCGNPALDWSYVGGDPDELVNEDYRGFRLAYSLDPAFYVARCRSCHRRHDVAARRARQAVAR